MINILLCTAHPDDELIWLGSSLYEINKLEDVNIYNICFWAILEPPGSMKAVSKGYKDIDRKEQFYEVSKYMNFKSHIITETKYHVDKNKNQKDDVIYKEFYKSLEILGIKLSNIDLIITHSYYGDERKHRHHIRLYDFFSNFCLKNHIGFSFFSILRVPGIEHKSDYRDTRRKGDLHIISFEKLNNDKFNICNKPSYLIEFQGNLTKKLEALKIYKAVDFEIHYKSYAGFTLITEKLYFNDLALPIISKVKNSIPKIVDKIL